LKSLDLFLDFGFDLLTWPGSWACSPGETQAQENPSNVKNAWAWTLGTGKSPGLGPEPARSLVGMNLVFRQPLGVWYYGVISRVWYFGKL